MNKPAASYPVTNKWHYNIAQICKGLMNKLQNIITSSNKTSPHRQQGKDMKKLEALRAMQALKMPVG